nr:hypothetical protein CFP56_11658 [Quercus suber]
MSAFSSSVDALIMTAACLAASSPRFDKGLSFSCMHVGRRLTVRMLPLGGLTFIPNFHLHDGTAVRTPLKTTTRGDSNNDSPTRLQAARCHACATISDSLHILMNLGQGKLLLHLRNGLWHILDPQIGTLKLVTEMAKGKICTGHILCFGDTRPTFDIATLIVPKRIAYWISFCIFCHQLCDLAF